MLCNNCRYNEEHYDFHNNNFLIFELDRGRVYSVVDKSWSSENIYFNDFMESFDYLGEEEKKT